MLRTNFPVAIALSVFGCGGELGPSARSTESPITTSATIEFTADYQTRVTGSLEAGGAAAINYAPARLTTCRGTIYSNPAWTIQAHYRIDGGPVRAITVAGMAPSADQVGLPLDLDRAGELEIWFENTSIHGCQAWDSALGRNYRFTVLPAQDDTPASAEFGADWSFNLTGQARQGNSLSIVYDAARLPSCRGRRYGMESWNILAHYRYASGHEGYVPVFLGGAPVPGGASLDLREAGELQVWFEAQDYYGCREWDSRFAQNYRIHVAADPRAPDWVGNAVSVINRMTCDGGPCDVNRVSLDNGFTFDSYARQRAAIRGIYFDVWKAGVTDFDNPELWRQLDVQVHFRWRNTGPFQTQYVRYFGRTGNNARYVVSLDEIDPLGGGFTRTETSQCPDADLLISGDPESTVVAANVQFYFTVNGVTLRRNDNSNYFGTFEQERAPFAICLPPR